MPEQGWEGMVLVGRIARPHGIRGEVVIDPSTGGAARIAGAARAGSS